MENNNDNWLWFNGDDLSSSWWMPCRCREIVNKVRVGCWGRFVAPQHLSIQNCMRFLIRQSVMFRETRRAWFYRASSLRWFLRKNYWRRRRVYVRNWLAFLEKRQLRTSYIWWTERSEGDFTLVGDLDRAGSCQHPLPYQMDKWWNVQRSRDIICSS